MTCKKRMPALANFALAQDMSWSYLFLHNNLQEVPWKDSSYLLHY